MGRGRRKPEGSMVVRAAYTSMLSLLLVYVIPGQAAGWIGREKFTKQQDTFPGASPLEDEIRRLELKHFEQQAGILGIELMADEVGERKRATIIDGVTRFCSVGIQITLIMGLGGLVFRLLPVLTNPDADEDDESNGQQCLMALESRSPYLLPGLAQQHLLVGYGEEKALQPREEEKDNALVALAPVGSGKENQDSAAEALVLLTKRRAAFRKARRLSRPLLQAMAIPLALLAVSRLLLGSFLAGRVDPMQELLFGDDIMMLYSDSKRVQAGQVEAPQTAKGRRSLIHGIHESRRRDEE